MTETILIGLVISDRTLSDSDEEEGVKFVKLRDNLLNAGYTIKETRLVAFNHGVYAHYVMRKEELK